MSVIGNTAAWWWAALKIGAASLALVQICVSGKKKHP